MAESIPGGAYLAADGVTWVDADGKPLDKTNAKVAQELHDARAQELEDIEQANVLLDARRDPTARALLAMQGQSSAGRVEPPAPARPTMAPSGRKTSEA